MTTQSTQPLWISKFSMRDLASALGAQLRGVDPEVCAQYLTTDSRQAASGALFVALVGERFDAHDFIPDVVSQGAVCVMVEREVEGAPCLVVKDTLVALQKLGTYLWSRAVEEFSPQSVALTGSNGKTTTKEILRALWSPQGSVYATSGNYNNHIGVPLTLCGMPQQVDATVVEMGANRVGDIEELIAMAPSEVRLLTSIGHAHIEGFGSIEGVKRAKSEIFGQASASTIGVVPWDHQELPKTQDFLGRIITFGDDARADIAIKSIEHQESGQRVHLVLPDRELRLTLPLIGTHHAHNLAGAVGCLWGRLGSKMASEEALNEALAGLVVPGGRWREVSVGPWVFVDDAYNANPASVLASFSAFLHWQTTQEDSVGRVVVLGEMLELGDEAKNWHQRITRAIAGVDDLSGLICVGTYAQDMVDAVSETKTFPVLAATDAEEAASLLASTWEGAIVWLKASRGMRLERIIAALQEEEPN